MKKFYLFLSPLLFISCVSAGKVNPVDDKTPVKTEIITVENGQLQGIVNDEDDIEIFAGIPFAAPPVGALRWKEPQPAANWEGVFQADHFVTIAMQNENGAIYNWLFNLYTHSKSSRTYHVPMSEDSLYLNVWRPKAVDGQSVTASSKLPVLVYVHGGSLMSGASWYEKYDGENLSKDGIIVVTIAGESAGSSPYSFW